MAYALHTLEQASHKRDATTDALVDFLVVRQRPDGSWPATTQRPPTEGSKFTNAALALRALRAYGPAEKGDRRDKVEAAFKKGKAWLLENEPETTEDRVFHLRALVTAEADEEDVFCAVVPDKHAFTLAGGVYTRNCGACEPECPVEAIFPEDALPEKWSPFVKINYAYPDAGEINRLTDEYATEHNVQNPPLE